jgi:hypothetical protein
VKIQNFIFTWNQYVDNAIQLERQLSSIYPTLVINSNINVNMKHWINVNDYYFAGQWNTLLSNIDDTVDFIFHIQADASHHDFNIIFDRFLQISNKYDIGVYAPNVDFTHHRYKLDKLKKYEDDLYFVPNTDCTCWFINRKLMNKSPLFDTSVNQIGFGVDFYYIARSLLSRHHVIRDYKYTIQHPQKTNYAVNNAIHQYNEWLQSISRDVKNKIEFLAIERSILLDF